MYVNYEDYMVEMNKLRALETADDSIPVECEGCSEPLHSHELSPVNGYMVCEWCEHDLTHF